MPADSITFPQTDALIHRLENGLEVIVKETPGTGLVSVQAWVRTGSIYEDSLLGSGVSHLVEHMVFKGAGHRGPTELAQAVQATGGYLNAYTSFDRTVYWVDTLQSGFATALDVVASLVSEAVFPADEFEREKDVIRREMDMGKDDPGRALGQLLFTTVFKHHPYREPVIGRRDLFDQVSRDAAFGYYQERYIPDRTFFVIAGDLSGADVLAAVEARMGGKSNRMLGHTILPQEPPQRGRREAHMDFATELTRMELAWRIPDLHHSDTPALEVLGVLLGQGRSSRLHQEIRESQGLVHEIGAGAYTPTEGGIFYVGAELDPDKREQTTAAVLSLLEKIKQSGVSADEVMKSRRMFLADQMGALMTTRGMASDLGSNWMVAGNLNFTSHYLEAVDRVTPQAVQEVARKYLVDETLSIVSLNPKGSATIKASKVVTSKSNEIHREVLDNGITLLIREDSRLPMVHFQATFRGGLLAETDATNGLSRLMARTLIKGANGKSAQEIMDAIESRGGALGASSGANSFSCNAGVLTPDLELGLELWADCILNPAFAATEIAREKELQLAALKAEEDQPSVLAFRLLKQHLFGSHPYHLGYNGTVDSLAGIDARAVSEFYARMAVTGNVVMAVFGDVKRGDILQRIERKFARMKSGDRQIPTNLPALPAATGALRELTRDKKQAVLAVAFPTVPLDHPDRTALDLIDETCSDMASRMFVRIREELGLAYSVGASQIIGFAPGAFVFHLSTSPAQLDFAQEELMKEIQKLVKHGLSSEEVNRSRMSLTGKYAMQAQTNPSLAEVAVLDELYGFGFDHRKEVLASVQSISTEAINEAITRYFSGEAVVARVKGIAGAEDEDNS